MSLTVHEKPNDHEDVIPPRSDTSLVNDSPQSATSAEVSSKQSDDVLPILTRQSLKDLANPAALTLLATNYRRAEAAAEALKIENARLDKDNKTLSVEVARLSERQKFKLLESIATTLAGAAFSAAGWPDVRGLATLLCIGIGIVLVIASVGMSISTSSSSKRGS